MEQQIIDALTRAPEQRLSRSALFILLNLNTPEVAQQYRVTEQNLVDQGRIERRRGRTGGIYLVDQLTLQGEQLEEVAAQQVVQERRGERAHYDNICRTIGGAWSQEFGFKKVICAVTAHQGRKDTGGRWTRPDMIVCTVSDWLFWPSPQGEVRTVEVKLFKALDVTAVYEAVAHRSQSHFSYLLIVEFPESLNDDQRRDLDRILAEAGRHGIGLITATNSNDATTWVYELDAKRSDTDALAIHELLEDQMPSDLRDEFARAVRNNP